MPASDGDRWPPHPASQGCDKSGLTFAHFGASILSQNTGRQQKKRLNPALIKAGFIRANNASSPDLKNPIVSGRRAYREFVPEPGSIETKCCPRRS